MRINYSLMRSGAAAIACAVEAVSAKQFLLQAGYHIFSADRYILQVYGDAMKGDNICDGDYVVCEYAEAAQEGEIIVALIDEHEATLKRIHYTAKHTVLLLPSNPHYTPKEYYPERIRVHGRYVGLLRLI